MKSMLMCNYVVGALGVLVGGLIMQASSTFPMAFTENGPGPGFWPFSLGTGMLIAAVLVLVYNFMNKAEMAKQEVSLSTPANKRVYMLMALLVVFCGLIELLGFYGAGLVLIPSIMLLMDFHDKKIIAMSTIGTLAFIYVIFSLVLGTQMPQSMFLR